MGDNVDFKQLLEHAEALSEGDLGGADGVRLLAYARTLEALYAEYTQGAAHKRVRLLEYRRRMEAVRDAVARSAALQPPVHFPSAQQEPLQPDPSHPDDAPQEEDEEEEEMNTSTTSTTRRGKEKKHKRRHGNGGISAEERRAAREATESDMAAMASMLRETATRLRDTVREDNRVVDEIAGIVDQHVAGTRTQRTKLAQSAPPWWREMLWYIVVCIVAVVVFNVALFFTGLFGRHDSALCRPPRIHLLSLSHHL